MKAGTFHYDPENEVNLLATGIKTDHQHLFVCKPKNSPTYALIGLDNVDQRSGQEELYLKSFSNDQPPVEVFSQLLLAGWSTQDLYRGS